jgi:hypothetical protein
MGKIFSLATRVLLWLGVEADGSAEAFRVLKTLNREVGIDVNPYQTRPSSQFTSVDWTDTTCYLPFMAGELILVQVLYDEPGSVRRSSSQKRVLSIAD